MREYFGVLNSYVPVDIGVQPAPKAAHLAHKEVFAFVKSDFVDEAVLAPLLAVVAVAQLDEPARVLVHHVAVQVLGVVGLVLTELAQVLLVTAVLLEVQVQLAAGGELHITLLTPVQVVVEVSVCYVLTQVLKNHRFVIAVFTDVRILLVEFYMLNELHFAGETFFTNFTDVSVCTCFMLQDHVLLQVREVLAVELTELTLVQAAAVGSQQGPFLLSCDIQSLVLLKDFTGLQRDFLKVLSFQLLR